MATKKTVKKTSKKTTKKTTKKTEAKPIKRAVSKKAEETYTLILYEEVPEKNSVLFIPDSVIDEADSIGGDWIREALEDFNGKYVGDTKEQPSERHALMVLDALCEDPKYWSGEFPRHQGILAKFAQIEGLKLPGHAGLPYPDIRIRNAYRFGFYQ